LYYNEYGQLGIRTEAYCTSPKRIELEVVVQKICCGPFHSLLLSRDGDIYVIGWNDYGQLGTNGENGEQLTPKKLIHLNKFIDIASHWRYRISYKLK